MTTAVVMQERPANGWDKVWPSALSAILVAIVLGVFQVFWEIPAEQTKMNMLDNKVEKLIESVNTLTSEVSQVKKVSSTVVALSAQMQELEGMQADVERLLIRIGELNERIEKIRDDRYTDKDADADLALIRQELREIFRMAVSNTETLRDRTPFMDKVNERLTRLEVRLENVLRQQDQANLNGRER